MWSILIRIWSLHWASSGGWDDGARPRRRTVPLAYGAAPWRTQGRCAFSSEGDSKAVISRNGLRRVSGGPGNGESCVACNEIIGKTQFAMEGIGDHLTALQFHVGCFSLWNIERAALAGAEPGAAQNGS
jgi:hypothetical protein